MTWDVNLWLYGEIAFENRVPTNEVSFIEFERD